MVNKAKQSVRERKKLTCMMLRPLPQYVVAHRKPYSIQLALPMNEHIFQFSYLASAMAT